VVEAISSGDFGVMGSKEMTSPSSFSVSTVSGIMNVTNATADAGNSLSIDNLYPAILQCFVIILIGYVAGRANWITSSQGSGIGNFVGKFCLPALLFKSMVELKFEQVNWYFLLGIAISKTIVFVLVAVLCLLIRRPRHFGIAGLFGIFATQSNDFALGYPICKYFCCSCLIRSYLGQYRSENVIGVCFKMQ
jgi:hypothetical protein